MSKSKARKKKLGLDLFLKKVKEADLPEWDGQIFRRYKASKKKLRKAMDKLEYELEETQAPFYKAMLESIGLSSKEMKEIIKKGKEIHIKFRKSIGKEFKEYMYSPAGAYGVLHLPPQLEKPLCKDVTIHVCQRKVCVDQPVPVSVDRVWAEIGSDGTLTWPESGSSSCFSYEDDVCGYSDWNWSYHRYSRVHDGVIVIRSSAELVQPAKVRQIGVFFEPLLDYRGWPKPNGVFPTGGYRPNPFTPRSRGRGEMGITFRVDSKIPGGPWVRRTDQYETYRTTGWINSRIFIEHAYPPPRSVNLNENFPAGTQFLIEAILSYEIEGNGEGGCTGADYNLEVKPYMNLEACSWEFPEWVLVHIG